MAHRNTVLSQILKIIPRHEFEPLAETHHQGQKLRKMTRWGQFTAMLIGQLSGRRSLRDLVDNLDAQCNKLYHIGVGKISRSTLARVNESQPAELYEALFYKILSKIKSISPKHSFKFDNPLYSMDASIIDLSLSVFPWADFRAKKGAVKLHVGLDHSGMIPAFLEVTEGNCHEIKAARNIDLPAGSILAIDRGYNDYDWFNQLNNKNIFFVTRLKKNAKYRVIERRNFDRSSQVSSDQEIKLTSKKGEQYTGRLRRVGFKCPDTGNHYYFLTNNMKLSAKTIAAIYKERWQIELFFKWIKQNLKIKTFLGTSKNAVMTQIWIAMCAYLMLTYIKLSGGIEKSIGSMVKLIQLTIFERRDMVDLFKPPPKSYTPEHFGQLRML